MFNRKKNKKEKNLEERINFTRIISIFFLVFFAWMIIASFLLLSMERIYSINDFLVMILPLPIFVVILIYLLEKDTQIELNNQQVQKELDRVKELHDARKRAEKEFDNHG